MKQIIISTLIGVSFVAMGYSAEVDTTQSNPNNIETLNAAAQDNQNLSVEMVRDSVQPSSQPNKVKIVSHPSSNSTSLQSASQEPEKPKKVVVLKSSPGKAATSHVVKGDKPTKPKVIVPREERPLRQNNIGGTADMTAGVGLSYKYWGASDFGFQVVFGPYGSYSNREGETSENELYLNAGLLLLKSLYKTHCVASAYPDCFRMNLYLYTGGNYLYSYQEDVEWDGSSYEPQTTYNYYGQEFPDLSRVEGHLVTAGAGFGVELHFWKLAVNANLGFKGTQSLYTETDETTGVDTDVKTVDFSPSIGIGVAWSFTAGDQ